MDNGASPFTDTLFSFWTETVPTVPSAAFADRANMTKSKVLNNLIIIYILVTGGKVRFFPRHLQISVVYIFTFNLSSITN